jgi:hypothetical protein
MIDGIVLLVGNLGTVIGKLHNFTITVLAISILVLHNLCVVLGGLVLLVGNLDMVLANLVPVVGNFGVVVAIPHCIQHRRDATRT